MRSRAFRPIAAILSLLLMAGTPVHAGPIVMSEVMQVLSSYQNPQSLRLRSTAQSSSVVDSGVRTLVTGSSGTQQGSNTKLDIPDTSTNSALTNTPDSLLSGVAVTSAVQADVEVVDQGEVDGTICDCGEITVPGGGFPKWPLLFLAAIPFFFIHGCDHCETPTPTPTPPPSPTPEIPEPATLLLFGTGLVAFGARLRRRYAKDELTVEADATEEA